MDINIELAEKYLKIKLKQTETTNKYKSSICLYDFFCLNNIKICEKIKEKYNLSNKYHVINNYSYLFQCEPQSRSPPLEPGDRAANRRRRLV